MCALFIGWDVKPTCKNVAGLWPVLISKRRVHQLINFLVANNIWCKIAGLSFSETNLDNLYPELKNTIVEATPIAVEICQLNSDQGVNAVIADYTAQCDMHPNLMDGTDVNPTTNPAMDPLVMGTIGYTSGDYTPHNLKVMKPEVLARVIDAGLTPKQWANMTAFECGVFVSNNPGSAAIFFDTLIKAFLTIVVRYGCGAGLFGTCLAHYGMVEAQGRGSLHCHMLLWLKGNLAPQDLHDHMSADDGFKTLMFTWLESIIHSHLPGEDALQTKTPGEPLHRPCKAHIADPCLNDELKSVNMTNEDFAIAFCQTVRDLAIECNWHKHTDTCWKYLKPGEPCDDQLCHMWIDGRQYTSFNRYIKFISSGESAKAFVYYVTKYITKSSLAAHISLAAVLYAIQQNNKKFQGLQPMAGTVNKSWFTKTVNAIMTRQELSHQQVMSYLVGGGDHYTSHTYKMIKWQQFDKYMATHFKASQQDDLSSHSIQLEDDSSQIGPEIELYIDDDLHKLPETDF
ncbi:hypothetical protein SERLA73DRAFT_150266 [Serpula lacrymans var. lacrymans S7.3]|uniref:Helitron helicase-like domain-containing protein n=1 Tax=Serpula lacrymans var. lacrymans (strain S7.3) TaxID=936435 RepID=F8PLT9_SERL3|nr:hypothetical protein SERLA73DRAFT_150266 [Serpula lacrymans var. lacrymans S7.3]